MAEEESEIEMAVPSGVTGGTSLVRTDATIDTPLSDRETAKFEGLLGKPGAHGAPKRPGPKPKPPSKPPPPVQTSSLCAYKATYEQFLRQSN